MGRCEPRQSVTVENVLPSLLMLVEPRIIAGSSPTIAPVTATAAAATTRVQRGETTSAIRAAEPITADTSPIPGANRGRQDRAWAAA